MDELYHHGVKGMKWGVRKDRVSSGSGNSSRKARREAKRKAREQARRQRDFETNVSRNWYKAYNQANTKFNPGIQEINNRPEFSKLDTNEFGEYTTITGYKYMEAANKLWQTSYSEALLNEFGEHPTRGKDWVKNAPFMDSYVPEDWVSSSVLEEVKKSSKG